MSGQDDSAASCGVENPAARDMNTQVARSIPWRRFLGLAIFLGGAAVILSGIFRMLLLDDPRMRGALTGGGMAALTTPSARLPASVSSACRWISGCGCWAFAPVRW